MTRPLRWAILVGVPFPDRLLADDEEVVRHLHPHWLTLVRPVLLLLLLVGGASFAAAAVPAGTAQVPVRLVVAGVAALLVTVLVLRPVLRWRTTHYVLTTHRLLLREGLLGRRGRDVRLSRITEISFTQTLGQRLIGSGTLVVEPAGEGEPVVLARIAGCAGVARLIDHVIEEDAERRAPAGTGYGTGPIGDGGFATAVR